MRLAEVTYPQWRACPWCDGTEYIRDKHEELSWHRRHAECVPGPVREAILTGWGEVNVHGDGRDPND